MKIATFYFDDHTNADIYEVESKFVMWYGGASHTFNKFPGYAEVKEFLLKDAG